PRAFPWSGPPPSPRRSPPRRAGELEKDGGGPLDAAPGDDSSLPIHRRTTDAPAFVWTRGQPISAHAEGRFSARTLGFTPTRTPLMRSQLRSSDRSTRRFRKKK